MEMSEQALGATIKSFRDLGQDYNTAQVRCPLCPAIFALVTPAVPAPAGNKAQVVAHENAVQGELRGHLQSSHAAEKAVRDPISGQPFDTVADLVAALQAGSRWVQRP